MQRSLKKGKIFLNLVNGFLNLSKFSGRLKTTSFRSRKGLGQVKRGLLKIQKDLRVSPPSS